VQYQFSGMVNPASVRATPDPLPVPPVLYHSADYRDLRWVIDGSEINRVLAYWRSGGYHVDGSGLDGYGAGTGSTNGSLHSADYRDARWVIDGSEVNRVLSYWRAGGYHVDPSGMDGYAPGRVASALQRGAAAQSASKSELHVRHGMPVVCVLGTTLQMTNQIIHHRPLLALLARPQLPVGWQLVSVVGDGNPEIANGEIVWTREIPASPIQVVFTLKAPTEADGRQPIGTEIEFQTTDMVNPAKVVDVTQTPDSLKIAGIHRLANGSVTVSLTGAIAEQCEVQASSNLVTWVKVTTHTNLDGITTFIDEDASSYPYRFYRAILKSDH
jgi:hypothetical protein